MILHKYSRHYDVVQTWNIILQAHDNYINSATQLLSMCYSQLYGNYTAACSTQATIILKYMVHSGFKATVVVQCWPISDVHAWMVN